MSKEIVEENPYINTGILLDNAPKESDDYEIEAEILDLQVKNAGVNNIAVVAPYGAGKSSAINTYLNRYRKKGFFQPKHIQISLADFNKDDETKNESANEDENAIEQSILQQLLYSQKKHRLPNSSIQRTNKSRPIVNLVFAFLAAIFLLSLITLIFELCGNGIFVGIFKNTSLVKPIAVSIVAISLVILLACFIKMGKLKSVKYKEFEVKIDSKEKNKEYSLINKYIDEVLYFFECINVDLVIFEDLDRFDSLKIFVKLRELNTIINNSPKRAKKVTFIYAVKDDMFADEKQRAKFFEFILPIVPVVNPITTADNIREISDTLKDIKNPLYLSEQFIKDISYFVSDMRVLKNTFNDYIIMANKLSDNSEQKLLLKKENLFALALYKNLYPYDYSRLQDGKGLIPLCVNKDNVVQYFKKFVQDEIEILESQIEKINKESLESFNELKLIFKGQNYNRNYEYFSEILQDVDKISTFENITKLKHPNYTSYSNYGVNLHSLPNGQTYYEREKCIKDKEYKQKNVLEDKIRVLSKDVDNIENSTLHTLIDKMGIEKYFSQERMEEIKLGYKEIVANEIFDGKNTDKLPEDKNDIVFNKQMDLIRMLINKDYIDEYYMEYISTYKSEISVTDRDFIRDVKRGYCKSNNYRLNNIRNVIKELNEEDFLQNAIIINDICKSLDLIKEEDDLYEVKTSKYHNLMKLFNQCKDTTIQSVLAFLSIADDNEKTVFAQHIVKNAIKFVEKLYNSVMSMKDKDIFANVMIKERKDVSQMSIIKQYIYEHENYTSIMKDIDFDWQCEFIAKNQIIFEKLDMSSGRDSLYSYIVDNNYYSMSVDNLKIVLNVEEDCEQFERRNYTYIMQSNKKEIEERIVNNLDLYIENVYLKLSQSYESEEVIANFLSNETIKEENKIGIITKTDFKFAKLKDINEKFYKQLLFEAKIEPTWENFLVAYNVIGFDESIKKFIDNINGEIYGKFSELPEDLNVKVFEDILSSEFDENVFIGLAKSIDRKFVLNEQYGKNNNIKSFILNGCFLYNKNDMRFLKNPPSTIPYLIAYQNNIKEEMKDFFGDISFKPLTVRNVIEEQMINLDFKKEYIIWR